MLVHTARGGLFRPRVLRKFLVFLQQQNPNKAKPKQSKKLSTGSNSGSNSGRSQNQNKQKLKTEQPDSMLDKEAVAEIIARQYCIAMEQYPCFFLMKTSKDELRAILDGDTIHTAPIITDLENADKSFFRSKLRAMIIAHTDRERRHQLLFAGVYVVLLCFIISIAYGESILNCF